MKKIKPLNPHYSMQNPATVYDEEALTTLEMCGRLGAKLNEVITAVNGCEVPQIVNVSPTGDETGELDRVVIQGKLDAGYSVHLSAGEYFLNGPLIFRPGYMLRGDSQLNTVINCKAGFIDHENIVSVDHVEVRDVRVIGPGTGTGIDISRKVEGVETGGRYAHFMNVYISGYDTGILLGGCWCTNFSHCRIEAQNICVKQRGSCNHIKYDHCVFLGPTGVPYDEMTAVGIDIGTETGAENYGISIDHCDFERFEICVKAYCCVALNVAHLYVEWSRKVFELDTCPAFLCDGGYASNVNRVCNTKKTNTAAVFNKCGGAIKNLFIRVNREDTFYMVSTVSGAPLDVENINCVNDGGGECIVNSQCANSIWNGHEHHMTINTNVDLDYLINTTGSYPFWDSDSRNGFTLVGYKSKPGNRYKVQGVSIFPATTFTATASATLNLEVNARSIGRTDAKSTDTVVIMQAYINKDQKYSMSSEIKFTPVVESYRDLITSDITSLMIISSANVGDVSGIANITLVNGEMIL